MFEFHTERNENNMACHYCSETFDNQNDLMKHRKESHRESVSECIFFITGKFDFGDNCWFGHNTSNKSSSEETTGYDCRFCGKTFKIRSDFMNHQKHQHKTHLPTCRNDVKGFCEFGPDLCWFNHTLKEKENDNEDNREIVFHNTTSKGENNELMEKLFDMMEKFSQRLVLIESKQV